MTQRAAHAVLIALTLCVAGALSQPSAARQAAQAGQPPPATPQQQPPVFRGGANLVRVDVTVTNTSGEPVANLTQDDFAVTEDGQPQTIQSFDFVRATGQPTDDRSLEIRSREHAASEASREDVRLFLIFWDEYHIGEFIPAIRGREVLSNFVRTAFAPTDLVGIMDQLTTVDSIRFTRDWDTLAEQVHNLKGRMGVLVPARSPIEEAQLRNPRDIARLRNEVTMTALNSAAAFLGNFREGRKALLFVSQGIPVYGRDGESSLFQEIVQTANTNNTAIYTLDPASQVGRTSDSLMSLAYATGGKPFVGTNTPGPLLKQMVRDASAFYLLGYASNRNPMDGKFHRISVHLKERSSYQVRARSGYFAPLAGSVEKARAEAAAAEVPADVEHALGELSGDGRLERSLDLWIGTALGPEGKTRVSVVWAPRRAAPPREREVAASLTLTAASPQGDPYFEVTDATARELAFDVPPGEMVLKTIVHNAKGDEIDGELRHVKAPAFAADRLGLGSPVVFVSRSALDARNIAAGQGPGPAVVREFDRTDRLFVRFPVYGTTAAPVVRLLNRQAKELRRLDASRISDGMYQIDLLLAPIARADYLIEIEVREGEKSERTIVPIRIR
jgi:VWFA-related protein